MDVPSVHAVATACGQVGPVSAQDPAYVRHLRTVGRFSVAEEADRLVGYAGGLALEGSAFLTDVFVLPEARSRGHGAALVEAMWGSATQRVTSASQDPRALGTYARFGARPRWPLLYLTVPGGPVPARMPAVHDRYTAGDAGWTLPGSGLVTVRILAESGNHATTAVVRRDGDTWTVLRAATPDPRGLAVLVADLCTRAGDSGAVEIVVPGPHPALRDLLAAGARITDIDLWCATDGAVDVIDPTRELPSPALA